MVDKVKGERECRISNPINLIGTVMPSVAELVSFSLNQFKPKSITRIKQLHALCITTDLQTPNVLRKLIESYCLHSPKSPASYAHRILNHQQPGNLFLLNTLIKSSHPRDSLLLFSNWVSRSCLRFDYHTYIFALGACARPATNSALIAGKQIHGRVIKEGMLVEIQVATTVIHFYVCNWDMECARKLFDEMPVRNNVSWSALLAGYSSQRDGCGMESAREALLLFKAMLTYEESSMRPTGTTMVSVLSASSRFGVLETGICIHGYVEKTVYFAEDDVFLGTALIDMYAKSGSLSSAMTVFNRMEERNVMTWTAMATGLALHGDGKQALKLLEEMKRNNVMPNVVTFTSLLSACCHAGLVSEGLQLFDSMKCGFGVMPNVQHYCCIVDILGRAGYLDEAYDFVAGSPFDPDPVLWRSLLSSCRLHEDTKMGEKVGKILVQIQPSMDLNDFGAASEDYVALSNVYALAGKWMDAGKVREKMKVDHVEIKPGHTVVRCV